MADDSRLEQFRAHLESSGRRLTYARSVIANAAFDAGRVIDAEELVRRFEQQPEHRISRASVYRVLSELQRLGLVSIRPPLP